MKRTFCFHKKKFLTLPPKQQHKKCAEPLRELYVSDLVSTLFDNYAMLIQWMGLDLKPLETKEELADRFHYHRQLAQVSLKEHHLLPCVTHYDKETSHNFLPIDIYLDRLRSAHNIGSIIRTCEALRLGHLFFSASMASPDQFQVQKTAMGAAAHITCQQAVGLESLRKPIIALETIPQAPAYYDFIFPEEFTLILGNEEEGCSQSSLAQADHYIQIPLYGKKNSLNVACSFAIVAAEIVKQKQNTKTNHRESCRKKTNLMSSTC